MPDYRANGVATTVVPRSGIKLESITAEYVVAAGLAANDTLALCKIPANVTIEEIILSCTGSLGATLTARLGDAADDDRFIAAGTFGQGAASLKRLDAVAGHGYRSTSDYELRLTVNTAATPTTGETIRATVFFNPQPKV